MLAGRVSSRKKLMGGLCFMVSPLLLAGAWLECQHNAIATMMQKRRKHHARRSAPQSRRRVPIAIPGP
jgi:hypothetical protein